jgi:hypothetical protein
MSFFDLNAYMADMIYEYIPGVKRVGSNKLNFRCPLCGDGKKKTSHRGWFYTDTGSYFCWNAGCIAADSGMQGLKFLSLISGKDITEIKSELIKRAGTFSNAVNKPKIKNIDQSLFDEMIESKNSKIEKYILDKIDLGEWTEKLPKFVETYINNRKLLKASFLPSDYKFYYDKKLKRLVIPWSDNYYQERTILKSQSKEDKYKFPAESEKPIFGLETLDTNFKYIFLVEGVFDSIWVKNGVAVGSLSLSNHQKELLKNYKDYTIVYLPDNQFLDLSSRNKSLKIAENNPYQNIFIWPEVLKKFKDINETTIFNDKFIDIWKDENFLLKYISSGISAKLKLLNI